jgi:CubicO group peptidase (beta-lactamase class C family)
LRVLVIVAIVSVLAACGGDRLPARQEAAQQAPPLIDAGRLDATLGAFVERGELVGVSALVFERGEEAYFGAFGMADREAGRPMRRDTLVRIFSMTKPITGVVLMTFYEEGLFALDDPLQKHLPEFAGIQVYAG